MYLSTEDPSLYNEKMTLNYKTCHKYTYQNGACFLPEDHDTLRPNHSIVF